MTMLNGFHKHHWETVAQHNQSSPKVTQVMFFSQNGLVHDHPMPVGTAVIGHYYCTHLQDKVRTGFCRKKKPELLEHCVILLQDIAIPHCHHDVQNLVQQWGLNVLAHPPYFPDLTPCDYWFCACVKKCLRSKRFESWYQHCSRCLFTLSEQGLIQGCNWSFTTYMRNVCGQCWWFVEVCVNIHEYQYSCYLVFCYCKTSHTELLQWLIWTTRGKEDKKNCWKW